MIDATTPETNASPQRPAGQRLRELYTEECTWRIGELGPMTMPAADEVTTLLPRVDETAQLARRRRWELTLAEALSIPRGELSASETIDLDIYVQQLETLIEAQRFRMWERPVNADSAFWRNLSFGALRQLLPDEAAARAYLDRLAEIPHYFAQQTENMRAGIERGFGPPQITMAGREAPVREVAETDDVSSLILYDPLRTLPSAMEPAVRAQLEREAREILRERTVPAYRELLTFLTSEYLPQLPESISALDQPDGEAFYTAQLREYTTTDLSPQEIFDIGMDEVAAIRQEMGQVADQLGFDGINALLAYMRSGEQFYAKTPRQLIAEAAYTCKSFDAVAHRFFGRLPEQRFGIVPTPPDIAPFDTFGRGAPDKYILNTYNLPARPLYSLPALTLHESAPGHSFHLSLTQELDLPDFRRIYISAFGEGWGLYCERLGVEMGMYETPYELAGMLSFQMWRAVRLVVDPGIHAFGWSRERAQDFLRKNTAIAEHEIVTEVDRYIAWPGQAASYYLGYLTLRRLRDAAETALGSRFDVREFHDAVLSLGNAPLEVLERYVTAFIEERSAPLP